MSGLSDKRGMNDPRQIGDDLLILFPYDRRPTARQVRAACETADFVDADGPELVNGRGHAHIAVVDGISLQRSGLVFDLVGLAPGPAIPVPELGGRGSGGGDIVPSRTLAASLRLGPHISAGRNSLAVLREWFAITQGIATHFDAVMICWTPGGVAIPIDKLGPHLAEWDARGQVPVSLLASFPYTLDGAIQSHGLRYFTGQEFRIESPLVGAEETPLARLLFSHLFFAGTQEETGQLTAPDGHALRLQPSDNGRYVRVWPG